MSAGRFLLEFAAFSAFVAAFGALMIFGEAMLEFPIP